MQKGLDTGNLRDHRGQDDDKADRLMRIINAEEQFLNVFQKNRSASAKSINRAVGMFYKILWHTLHEYLQHL